VFKKIKTKQICIHILVLNHEDQTKPLIDFFLTNPFASSHPSYLFVHCSLNRKVNLTLGFLFILTNRMGFSKLNPRVVRESMSESKKGFLNKGIDVGKTSSTHCF
jgi:hypothetical protein